MSISGDFPRIHFYNSGQSRHQIRSIKQWGSIVWKDMTYAFWGCPDLTYNASDAPDLSNVNSLGFMFNRTSSFNGDLNNWDVTNVTNMNGMFADATFFNRDLANWNVSNVTNMAEMFDGAPISPQNYDKTLTAWANLNTLKENVNLGAEGLVYCEAEESRTNLVNEYAWNIVGDIKVCQATNKPFITTWQISEGSSITIPIKGGANYSVDWGDGTETNDHTGSASHTYESTGIYTVKFLEYSQHLPSNMIDIDQVIIKDY